MTSAQTIVGKRIAPVAVAVLALSLLSACSSVKLMYGFADSALESRAERYLHLDTANEATVEQETTALVAWHRSAMLPRYAAFLDGVADVAERGQWDAATVNAAFQQFRNLIDATALGASPHFAAVLIEHTAPEKVAYLRQATRDYIAEELAEENVSEAARLEEVMARRQRSFERFVGPLSDSQVEIIRRHAAPTIGARTVWLNQLAKRHQALADYLAAQPDRADLAVFVHRLLIRGYEITDPAYEEISDARWRGLEALYLDILKSLSAEQQRHLVETLRGYAADMMELAGSA